VEAESKVATAHRQRLTSVGVPSALVLFVADQIINAYLEQNPKQR
jgi:hypothetical protein